MTPWQASSRSSESRILRRRERDRVKREHPESSVLGLFQVNTQHFFVICFDLQLFEMRKNWFYVRLWVSNNNEIMTFQKISLKDFKERNTVIRMTGQKVSLSSFGKIWDALKSTYMNCSTVVNSRIFGKQDLQCDFFSSSNKRLTN